MMVNKFSQNVWYVKKNRKFFNNDIGNISLLLEFLETKVF